MSYQVNEIFYSLQGEGARAGTANVFVRFSGCNLTCSADGPEGFDCDTEFTSGVRYTLDELLEAIQVARAEKHQGKQSESFAVILTGGEPSLQVDQDLITTLHMDSAFVAIETNGTHALPDGIDWVSCSPKTAEHTLRVGKVDELRYVRNPGQGLPKPTLLSDHHFLSPAADADGTINRASLNHCMTLCLQNPKWRLSVQQHKGWNVR